MLARYVPGKHDSSINIQTAYTDTTERDLVRVVKIMILPNFFFKLDNFNVLKILL